MEMGSIDVKSSPVYFYVQKNNSHSGDNSTVTFEIEQLNVGGAMDLSSGIFTAPTSGTYLFTFSGRKSINQQTAWVSLYWNDSPVASAYAQATVDIITMSLSSTLHLQQSDQVRLVLRNGELFDNSHKNSHFNGILLQEDLFQ